jgi:putative ABC transport system ATP-binding protein
MAAIDPGHEAPLVALRGVTKVHEGGVVALREVSLDVHRGEQVAVVGPSGSGKSTLLSILGTLERPTSGSVMIQGHDAALLSDRQLAALRGVAIGFVFQQFHLIKSLSARENVEQALLYLGAPRAERRERALAALDRVGLGDRTTHRPAELSGGEQQRVAIARAIVKRPQLILADEPTGNLDSATGRQIVATLAELGAEGTTIVLITHDRELAGSYPRHVDVRDGIVEAYAAA